MSRSNDIVVWTMVFIGLLAATYTVAHTIIPLTHQ
jgi:hypothetical protein